MGQTVKPAPKPRPPYEPPKNYIEEVAPVPVPPIKTEAPILVEDEPHQDDGGGQLVGIEEEQYHDDQGYGYEEQGYDESMQAYDQGHQQFGDSSQGWGSKAFQCEQCDKSFSSKKSLQNHRNSHRGRTFCEHCNRNFSTVSNLKAHMNMLHQEGFFGS